MLRATTKTKSRVTWNVWGARTRSIKIGLIASAFSVTAIWFVHFHQNIGVTSGYISAHKKEANERGLNEFLIQNVNISNTRVMSSSGEHTRHPDTFNMTLVERKRQTIIKNEVKDSCTFPQTDPFDPVVMSFTKIYPPITCKGGVPHLVYMDGDIIKVNNSKTALVGDKDRRFKECRYKSLDKKPGSDFETVVLYTSQLFNNSITLRNSDDNLVVECYDNNNMVISRSYFSLIRVKKDLEILLEENFTKHQAIIAPKEVFNIFLIGMDGMSKQNFQRQMPKTRNYLLNILNATELHKHNKVGDNTFPNVVPLLTGQPEAFLYRNNWTWQEHFDSVNDDFLWSDFHKAGYRTGVMSDHMFTAFHYQKKGWNKSPVDYYLRPTVLELYYDQLMTGRDPNCVGDIPEITYNHNFWIQMASTFNNSRTKPFFGYSFYHRLTHDDQHRASAGDELYFRFFQELRDKNIVNSTVIVFFSDHGPRFGTARTTNSGMVESNTPFVFLIFPPWFHQKYPDLMKVLKLNQERLTTNFDLYETLLDLLNFQAKTGFGDVNMRRISLFQEIPRERTCQHVGIAEIFCACNQLTQTNV